MQAPKPNDLLSSIGNTPMVEITKMDCGPCRLFVKMENQNPGGSIKDRIALKMIDEAEKAGSLKPGGLIVEATAGNTGLGLALVAALKGYRLLLVIPDKMSREKIFHLKAMGAEVRLTRSDVVKGHPDYYQDVAMRIAKEMNGYFINQFCNPANAKAHEETTGPEILAQLDGDVDAVVCGVGSGGTLAGLTHFFKRASKKTEMVLADPQGSILVDYIKTGKIGPSGSWMVEGVGEDFIPEICDLSLVRSAYTVTDAESFQTARDLLKKEGILAGSSAGTLVAAALRYCREQKTPKKVVSFICDSGNKYLSKMFNDYWMIDQGFIQRPKTNDLRDLIARPYSDGSTISVAPGDTLAMAYGRMKLYDVSQLPVLEKTKIVGFLDESDLLLQVYNQQESFKKPVSEAMVKRVEKIDPKEPISSLMPVFDRDHVAVIVDKEDHFYGLITRMDLLNHLRRMN